MDTPSSPQDTNIPARPPGNWQLPALFIFGIVFIAILLWLVFSRQSISQSQCFLVRIVLALAAAGIGAIVPGTINANAPGIAKAGGAAAFFVIVLALYPCREDPKPTSSNSSSAAQSEARPAVEAAPREPTSEVRPKEIKPQTDTQLNAETESTEPHSPPKADPVYVAWLGRWSYTLGNHFANGNPYDENTWSIDVIKDTQTKDLTGQVNFDHYDANGTGRTCQVAYTLNFSKPYYIEGLDFEGNLIWEQGKCPYENPPKVKGTLLSKPNGGMQFSIAYNMNLQTDRTFTRVMGPCKIAGGGFFAECLPDPSAAYH